MFWVPTKNPLIKKMCEAKQTNILYLKPKISTTTDDESQPLTLMLQGHTRKLFYF